MANETKNDIGSVTALAELAKKIERQPGWRALADPALVAEVYRRTARFDLVERWADGYRDPDALLRAILAVDAADFGGDVVLAYVAKIDADMAEMNRALAQGQATRKIYVVRFYFTDGDGYDRYEDHSFYANVEDAERKCDELNAGGPFGYVDDGYRFDEVELITA